MVTALLSDVRLAVRTLWRARGLLVGVAGAMVTARWLASELYQVSGTDPLVLAGTTATVLAVALLASSIPAWRAGRFNPIAILRDE